MSVLMNIVFVGDMNINVHKCFRSDKSEIEEVAMQLPFFFLGTG